MGRLSMRMMGLGLVLVLLTGCAAVLLAGAGAGIGTYAYVKGELQREYNASLDHTWAATVQSLKSLEVQVVDTQKDQFGGKIEAKLWDGRPVKLTLEPKGSGSTLVGIRVGTFGDRDTSERIGKEIEKRV